MPTLQAVWPADLMERRSAALVLEGRIRAALAAGSGPAAADLAELRAALVELPCPHWDVEASDDDVATWGCVACHDFITPMWVDVADQEQALRRAAHQRSARRPGRATRADA